MADRDDTVAAVFLDRMESLHDLAVESLRSGKLTPSDVEVLQSADDETQILGRAMASWIAGWERDNGPGIAQPIAVCMWRMMLNAMLIGQHGTLTESAQEHFRGASLKAARDAKAATMAAKEYDKIVSRIATEHVQKHGLWKLGERAFAQRLLPDINKSVAAALLKPLKEGAVRSRIKRYLAPR